MDNTMHISTGIPNLKGNEILAMLQKTERGTFVAIKPLCGHLKIAWQSQHAKLAENPRFNCHDIMMVGSDGKHRVMTCLPANQVADWINSINSRKVAEEKREALLQLQKFFQHALDSVVHGDFVTRSELMSIVEKLQEQIAARDAVIATQNETLQHFFNSGKFEATAAAYEMNAAKERKKALKIVS